jgi:isopentenyl-diphosphate delta-isomerase
VNPEEASQIRWIAFEDLKKELRETPERFSSWFIIAAPKVMAFLEREGERSCGQQVEGEQ